MHILITYDIVDNKRRQKVAAYLEEKGLRTQKSVFECEMDTALLQSVRQFLTKCIDPATDSVLFYPVCRHCTHNVQVLGQGIAIIKTNWVVV